MKLPFYISESLKAYFEVASEDRRALLDTELFNTDPLTCKKEYLSLLAVEAGVDIDGFEEQRQRDLIQNAFKSFNMAGTIGALKSALSPIGDIKVLEKEDFSFDIDLSFTDMEITPQIVEKVKAIAKDKKNVRSVLHELMLSYMQSEEIVVGGGSVCEATAQISSPNEYVGIASFEQEFSGGVVGEAYAYFEMKE